MEEFDPDAIAERADAALVAYPHKAAALAVKALRERGLKVVDLSADFRLDQAAYEHWYQPHEAPELLDGGGLRPARGPPRARSEAPTWSPAPAATRPPRCSRCCRCAGRIEEAAVDIKAGVSGAGREATDETHFVSVVDNVNAYKVEGHRHTRRARAGAARRALQLRRPPAADRPGHPRELLRAPVASRSRRRRRDELFVEAYRDEPFVEVLDYPPRTRDVRDTQPRDRAGRRSSTSACSRSARSTTSGRAPPARRCRTST